MERLALKYRPKKYEDVVGQKHVLTILRKMHEKSIVPAGFLFLGSRGTGKTTVARILSMRLNCDADDGPCGVCSSCVSIIDGTSASVNEIDAASHGNVDDIREIKERSQYGHPGKYRVWLIDEAHSLSRKANDALLKIVEEPPVNTIFILVTTEPDEIIETVRSRLMPFEFRRITISDMVGRLSHICKSEDVEFDDDVLESIADYVDGGVRDAVTMLEQLYYFSGKLTLNSFYELYGVVGRTSFDRLFGMLLDGKHKEGQDFIIDCFTRASEGRQFIKGLIKYLTEILVYKQGVKRSVNKDIANGLDVDLIFKMINLMWSMMARVRYSSSLVGFAPQILYCSLVELLGVTGNNVSEKVLTGDAVLEKFKDIL